MQLSIIIISYNTADVLKDCLTSVFTDINHSTLKGKVEVIVVDNASTDGSVKMIQKEYPQVILTRNKKNIGFAAANNQGIGLSKGEYILLLNSDTIVQKGALEVLVQRIKKDTDIGVIGPKLLNADKTLQYSMGFFPELGNVFSWMFFIDDLPIFSSLLPAYHIESPARYKKEMDVGWVSGACMLIRKHVITKSGLLDERIFMYGEEVEWCYRIKKAGFRVLFIPEAEVIHLKGASASVATSAGITEEFPSLLYFYRRHKPSWQLAVLRIFLQCGILLRMALFGIIGKHRSRIPNYAKALKMVRR